MIRCLYLGEKKIGERLFEKILSKQRDNFQIVAVISNQTVEDNWWGSANISEYAREADIPFFAREEISPSKVEDIIIDHDVNLILSIQSSILIPPSALQSVDGRVFNLHLAKLPEYRGFYAINHALLNQDKEYFVTIHWVVNEIDAGNIAYEDYVSIANDETAVSLHNKANELGEKLFSLLFDDLLNGSKIPSSQQIGKGKYFDRSSLVDLRKISDPDNVEELDIKSRAFYFPGFPPAFVEVKGQRFGIVPYVDQVTKV